MAFVPPLAELRPDVLYFAPMHLLSHMSKRRRRGFTLMELLVIIAIIAVMTTVSVLSISGGQKAARVKGATRDVFAAIRHARSQALVSQRPVVVTYSVETDEGEPVATVKMDGVKLFSSGVDRSKIQKITGGYLPPLKGEAEEKAETKEAEGSLVSDLLVTPISTEVVRGMRLKVVKGEDLEQTDAAKPRVSIFSNVDYLLKKYQEATAQTATTDAAADGASASKDAAPAATEAQAPVSIVFDTTGRVEPHQVWVYADGQRPEDGLSIRIDRFGGAKVLTGSGQEGD